MYVARSGKLYFYKYNYDRDIIVGNDLKYATLFSIENRKTEQLKNRGFKIYKLSETEVESK